MVVNNPNKIILFNQCYACTNTIFFFFFSSTSTVEEYRAVDVSDIVFAEPVIFSRTNVEKAGTKRHSNCATKLVSILI